MTEQGWKAFLAAEGVDDWVVVHGGATAVFRVRSLSEAARLAEAIAKAPAIAGAGVREGTSRHGSRQPSRRAAVSSMRRMHQPTGRWPTARGTAFAFARGRMVHSMPTEPCRTICWTPIWNKNRQGVGLEHLLLAERSADSIVLAFDEERGPFRLTYRLTWEPSWQLRDAELVVATERFTRSLSLQTDGQGHWRHRDGQTIDDLDGCMDVDIWPTPFTNTFPIRREPMAIGERRQFRMAWIFAPELTVQAQPQAYTRLADRLYLFENLDGTNFRAELSVDEDGIVLDYPDLFRRVPVDV
jgi:uncharacterized protein